MTEKAIESRERSRSVAARMNRAVHTLSKNWFLAAAGLLWLWVGLPWLAPVFMKIGWRAPAEAIYTLYSFQCHQMPQRSFFLFGEKMMYSLEEIQRVWNSGANPLVLRQFVGNAEMGYKVAWSDRMVSAYGSIPLAATLWWPLQRRIRPLPFLGLVLLALPMAIDGSTHFVSDLAGLGQGFRYTNAWLAELTGHSFGQSFYVGNALGSFNSWMRLLTGTMFGFGLAFFALPHIDVSFSGQARQIESKFDRAGIQL